MLHGQALLILSNLQHCTQIPRDKCTGHYIPGTAALLQVTKLMQQCSPQDFKEAWGHSECNFQQCLYEACCSLNNEIFVQTVNNVQPNTARR